VYPVVAEHRVRVVLGGMIKGVHQQGKHLLEEHRLYIITTWHL
jgi:hypothetical protein